MSQRDGDKEKQHPKHRREKLEKIRKHEGSSCLPDWFAQSLHTSRELRQQLNADLKSSKEKGIEEAQESESQGLLKSYIANYAAYVDITLLNAELEGLHELADFLRRNTPIALRKQLSRIPSMRSGQGAAPPGYKEDTDEEERDPLAWGRSLPDAYAHKEEHQAGEQSKLMAFWLDNGETRKRIAEPHEKDHAKHTGYLIMRYDTYDPVDRKHTRAALSGTATLYERISEEVFVISSAAHNFIQFEENAMLRQAAGNQKRNKRKEASEAFFYLACDGEADSEQQSSKYQFKFEVLGWKVHPRYEKATDYLNGKDVALAAVRVVKEDESFKAEEFAKLEAPKAAFIKDAELEELKAKGTQAELRVLGYPMEVFVGGGKDSNGKLQSGRTELNPQHLYEGTGPAQDVVTHEWGTTTLKYGSTELVTGKGQSGGTVQLLNSDGSFQTIGVHVGHKSEQNFGAALTEKLFLDFLHPALKELYDKHKSKDGSEDAQYAQVLATLREHQAAADERALARQGEEVRRQEAELDSSKAKLESRRRENIERIKKQRLEEKREDLELLEQDQEAKNPDLEKLCALLDRAPDFQGYEQKSGFLKTFQKKCGSQDGGHLDAAALLRACLLTLERDQAAEGKPLVQYRVDKADTGEYIYIREGQMVREEDIINKIAAQQIAELEKRVRECQYAPQEAGSQEDLAQEPEIQAKDKAMAGQTNKGKGKEYYAAQLCRILGAESDCIRLGCKEKNAASSSSAKEPIIYGPISGDDGSLFSALEDGVVLANLLFRLGANKATLDLSKIDLEAARDPLRMQANAKICLEAAKKMGIETKHTLTDDFSKQAENGVLCFLDQVQKVFPLEKEPQRRTKAQRESPENRQRLKKVEADDRLAKKKEEVEEALKQLKEQEKKSASRIQKARKEAGGEKQDEKYDSDGKVLKLSGIGRKIRLVPQYETINGKKELTGFDYDMCYIQEGQFTPQLPDGESCFIRDGQRVEMRDELNGFGRKLFSNGDHCIGWFKSAKLNGYCERIRSNGTRNKGIHKDHVFGASKRSWQQVRHVAPAAADSAGASNLSADHLKGTETYGSPDESEDAWAIMFNHLHFTEMKVESVEEGFYCKEYAKDDLVGKMTAEELLKDIKNIKEVSGINVYIYVTEEDHEIQNTFEGLERKWSDYIKLVDQAPPSDIVTVVARRQEGTQIADYRTNTIQAVEVNQLTEGLKKHVENGADSIPENREDPTGFWAERREEEQKMASDFDAMHRVLVVTAEDTAGKGGRLFLAQNLAGACKEQQFIKSVQTRQVIKYIDKKDFPAEALFDGKDGNWSVFLEFIRQHSRDHRTIFELTRCGEGGESFVLVGDMPGTNVVIKVPRNANETERAMEETQLIEILHDWMGCESFVVQTREELIVCDKDTRGILFYCAFYERVRQEMPASIPKKVIDSYKVPEHLKKEFIPGQKHPMNHEWYSGEYLSVLGTVVIYLFQGLSIMKDFSDKDLYFGDYKGENFLVTFHGKRLKIGDFGCSMVTQEDTEADPQNFLKGLTPAFALAEARERMKSEKPVSRELLRRNDLHAFFQTFEKLIETELRAVLAKYDQPDKDFQVRNLLNWAIKKCREVAEEENIDAAYTAFLKGLICEIKFEELDANQLKHFFRHHYRNWSAVRTIPATVRSLAEAQEKLKQEGGREVKDKRTIGCWESIKDDALTGTEAYGKAELALRKADEPRAEGFDDKEFSWFLVETGGEGKDGRDDTELRCRCTSCDGCPHPKRISQKFSREELQGKLQELYLIEDRLVLGRPHEAPEDAVPFIRDREAIKRKGGLTIYKWCAHVAEWCDTVKHVFGGAPNSTKKSANAAKPWEIKGQELLELNEQTLKAEYQITQPHARAALLRAKSCAGTTVKSGIDLIVPALQHPDIEAALKEALLDAMRPHISEEQMANYEKQLAAGGPQMDEERVQAAYESVGGSSQGDELTGTVQRLCGIAAAYLNQRDLAAGAKFLLRAAEVLEQSARLCGDAVGAYEQLVLEACWALAYLGELDAALNITIAFCKRLVEAAGLRFWPCYQPCLKQIFDLAQYSELAKEVAMINPHSSADPALIDAGRIQLLESRLIASEGQAAIGDIANLLKEIKRRYGNEDFLAVKLNMLYSYAQLQAGSRRVSRLYLLFYGESYIKHGQEMLLLERFYALAKQKNDEETVAMLDLLFSSVKKPQTVYDEPEEHHRQVAARVSEPYQSFTMPKEQVEAKWKELRLLLEQAKPGHDREEQEAMLKEVNEAKVDEANVRLTALHEEDAQANNATAGNTLDDIYKLFANDQGAIAFGGVQFSPEAEQKLLGHLDEQGRRQGGWLRSHGTLDAKKLLEKGVMCTARDVCGQPLPVTLEVSTRVVEPSDVSPFAYTDSDKKFKGVVDGQQYYDRKLKAVPEGDPRLAEDSEAEGYDVLTIRAGQLHDGLLAGVGRKIEIVEPQYAEDEADADQGSSLIENRKIIDFSGILIKEGQFSISEVDVNTKELTDGLWCFGRCFDPVTGAFSIGRFKTKDKLHGFGKQLDRPAIDRKDYSETEATWRARPYQLQTLEGLFAIGTCKDKASIQKTSKTSSYDVDSLMARAEDWELEYTVWTPGSELRKNRAHQDSKRRAEDARARRTVEPQSRPEEEAKLQEEIKTELQERAQLKQDEEAKNGELQRLYDLFANQKDPTYFADNHKELGATPSERYPIEEERKAGLVSFTKECAAKLQGLLTEDGPLDAAALLKDGEMLLSRAPDGKTLTPFALDVQQDDANIYIRSGQLIDRQLAGLGRKVQIHNPTYLVQCPKGHTCKKIVGPQKEEDGNKPIRQGHKCQGQPGHPCTTKVASCDCKEVCIPARGKETKAQKNARQAAIKEELLYRCDEGDCDYVVCLSCCQRRDTGRAIIVSDFSTALIKDGQFQEDRLWGFGRAADAAAGYFRIGYFRNDGPHGFAKDVLRARTRIGLWISADNRRKPPADAAAADFDRNVAGQNQALDYTKDARIAQERDLELSYTAWQPQERKAAEKARIGGQVASGNHRKEQEAILKGAAGAAAPDKERLVALHSADEQRQDPGLRGVYDLFGTAPGENSFGGVQFSPESLQKLAGLLGYKERTVRGQPNHHGQLDVKKLLQEGRMFVARDDANKMIPLGVDVRIDKWLCPAGHAMEIKYHGGHSCDACGVQLGKTVKHPSFLTCGACNQDRCMKCVDTELGKRGSNICIRSGQLIGKYLNGVGRKISLRKLQHDADGKITDFEAAICEGQFHEDRLWCFGRSLDHDAGQFRIGMFKECMELKADRLHGRARAVVCGGARKGLYRVPAPEEIKERPGFDLDSFLLPAAENPEADKTAKTEDELLAQKALRLKLAVPADGSYGLASLVAEEVDWMSGYIKYPTPEIRTREEERINAQDRRGAQRVAQDALLDGSNEEAVQAALKKSLELQKRAVEQKNEVLPRVKSLFAEPADPAHLGGLALTEECQEKLNAILTGTADGTFAGTGPRPRALNAQALLDNGLMTLSRDGQEELPVPFEVERVKTGFSGSTLCIRAGQLVDGYLNGLGRKLEIRDAQYEGEGEKLLKDFSSATIREGEFFSDLLWSAGRFFDSESKERGIGLYQAGRLHGQGEAVLKADRGGMQNPQSGPYAHGKHFGTGHDRFQCGVNTVRVLESDTDWCKACRKALNDRDE